MYGYSQTSQSKSCSCVVKYIFSKKKCFQQSKGEMWVFFWKLKVLYMFYPSYTIAVHYYITLC